MPRDRNSVSGVVITTLEGIALSMPPG